MSKQRKVLWIEDYTPDLELPDSTWEYFSAGEIELWNAPRPIPGHEKYQGKFMHGVFYTVIVPGMDNDDYLRDTCKSLDAWPVEIVRRADVEAGLAKLIESYGEAGESIDLGELSYDEQILSYLGWRRKKYGDC